jgi:hypothetical protein
VPRRRRYRLRWPGWRGRALIAAVAAVAVCAAYLISTQTAAPIRLAGLSSWWYPQDIARSVETTEVDGTWVTMVPIRPGQQQGFAVSVDNPSSWTQTVLGTTAGFVTPGGPDHIQIAVAGYNRTIARGGGDFHSLSYVSPGAIPPHQVRALRVLWTTTICQQDGGHTLIDELDLRVRVGWTTRTEVVPLGGYWTLSGSSCGE